jgi:hypothetical protein
MTNERRDEGIGQDRVLDGVVRWDLGMGSSHANEILWRCDATRAGRLYDRTLFGTREARSGTNAYSQYGFAGCSVKAAARFA